MNNQKETSKGQTSDPENKMPLHIVLPAEWEPQSGIQLTWPHSGTDWAPMLDEISQCYARIVREIIRFEPVMIVTPSADIVHPYIEDLDQDRIHICEVRGTNDTWARDHGGITVTNNDKPAVLNFIFNGWGMKYPANYDNQIVSEMESGQAFAPGIKVFSPPFVLEGGSIESDGCGTVLTTASCLFSNNRNEPWLSHNTKDDLAFFLGADRLLVLENGYLEGDDTDGHVDTLARFCDPETIAYVQCTDPDDSHFDELLAMERELLALRTAEGKPYRLISLPMAEPVFDEDGYQLPATYANFLILNGAVLVPAYGNDELDEQAREVLQTAFPDREIISVDCLPLIQQGGAIHCATMQYPAGVLNVYTDDDEAESDEYSPL